MTTLFDDEDRLNKIKIDMEVERIVAQRLPSEIRKVLKDPVQLQIIIQEQNKELEILRPQAELYQSFLDSMGEISCNHAHKMVNLFYVNPQGKKEKMGSDYFINLLVLDKIIYMGFDGYEIYSSHKNHGRTAFSTKNNRNFTSVLFNSTGANYIVKKYLNDDRIFFSKNRRLYIKGEI
jgi:phage antirepressor YoqD-like protein